MDEVLFVKREEIMNHKDWTLDDFDIGRPLGSGRFGRVYLAREKRSKQELLVGLKILFKSMLVKHESEINFKREVEIQSKLNHPNVLRLFTWFHDDKRIYLVLEFALKGNVLKELDDHGPFNDVKAATYIHQTALALNYLHGKSIIHRDLKPENLLLGCFNEIKLADFGWALECDSEDTTPDDFKLAGTLDYLSPEMIANVMYDHKVDVWCLGVLTFELLVGRTPFFCEDKKKTQELITKVKYSFPSEMKKVAKELISKLLVKDAKKRIELNDVVSHEWIQTFASKKDDYVKYFHGYQEIVID